MPTICGIPIRFPKFIRKWWKRRKNRTRVWTRNESIQDALREREELDKLFGARPAPPVAIPDPPDGEDCQTCSEMRLMGYDIKHVHKKSDKSDSVVIARTERSESVSIAKADKSQSVKVKRRAESIQDALRQREELDKQFGARPTPSAILDPHDGVDCQTCSKMRLMGYNIKHVHKKSDKSESVVIAKTERSESVSIAEADKSQSVSAVKTDRCESVSIEKVARKLVQEVFDKIRMEFGYGGFEKEDFGKELGEQEEPKEIGQKEENEDDEFIMDFKGETIVVMEFDGDEA